MKATTFTPDPPVVASPSLGL